jgi:uncharacterized repeat protein (TIGR01451 family)
MIRRWFLACVAMMLCTTLATEAVAQSPSSLADRLKQLRREWTQDDEEEEEPKADEPTERSVMVAPRAGSASGPQGVVTPPRGGLPQIEPRSLLPSQFRGGDDSRRSANASEKPATSGQMPQRSAARSDVSTRNVATNSPSILGENSSRQRVSTARRSPPTRPPVDFESGKLHNELVGTSPAPTASQVTAEPIPATAGPAKAEPTILDDFGAGLSGDSKAPAASARPTVRPRRTQNPVSSGPINLPATPTRSVPSPTATSTVTAEPIESGPEPDLADEADRYGATSTSSPASSGTVTQAPVAAAAPTSATPFSTAVTPIETPASDSASGRVIVGGGQNSFNHQEAAKAFATSGQPSTPSISTPINSVPVAPRDAMTGQAAESRRESFARMENDLPAGAGVLVTNQAPAITSDIRGPKQIAIGREATYRIRLQNQGAIGADMVVATVRVPAWAEVINTAATNGTVRPTASDSTATVLQWQVARLDAQAAETLSVDLIPRASRPMELGVTWAHDPVATRTIVEVQEPKLQLSVTGPEDVLFGKSHVYRLSLTNPGTGVAENVRIQLLPPGGGAEAVSTFEVGSLPPGATKTAEVELTAREAGKLSVQAIATADGNLKSEAMKELFCRKPELEVDWRGPETQYAGTAATYFFRVRNPGTAAADDVAVTVNLPAGAEFVSASEGHVLDRTNRAIAWRVGSLGPGDDCYMELRCMVNTPGENKIAVSAATSTGELTDNKSGTTNVIALADLKLDVTDPSGPVAVGDEAVYEIRVTNRGASAAEDVNVVGLFSAGLEPDMIDGAPYTVSDGRVAFRTIKKLPAGQEVQLQIRARATEAGTHVFRAEVLCRDSEIKLAAEETTRFYESQVTHDAPAAPNAAPATPQASATSSPAGFPQATMPQTSGDNRYQ